MYMQTIDKLKEMRLHGMARSFQERRIRPDHQELSHDEFIGLLVDDEYIYRQNSRYHRLLQMARLKFPVSETGRDRLSEKPGDNQIQDHRAAK